jgi:hypothetical protein
LLVVKLDTGGFTAIFREKRIKNFVLRSCNEEDPGEERWTLYYTNDRNQVKKTNFCELCKVPASNIAADHFLIQKNLHTIRTALRSVLDNSGKNRRLKLLSLLQNKCSRIAHSQQFDDFLARFGSTFTRTCNDKLVIGIPLINVG